MDDGQINFKAYFDYGDAMRGVDDLTNKFEAAGMKLQDAFDFGRSFEGSKQELQRFIGDLETTLSSIKQQIKDATTGMAGDKTLREGLQHQLEAAKADLAQANDVISNFHFDQNKAIGQVLDPIAEAIRDKTAMVAKMSKELSELSTESIADEVEALKKLRDSLKDVADEEERQKKKAALALRTQTLGQTLDWETDQYGAPTIKPEDLDEITDELIKLKVAAREADLEVQNALTGQEIEDLEEKYESLRAQLEDDAGKDSFLTSMQEKANAAKQSVDELTQQLKDLDEGVGGSGKTQEDLDELKKKAEQLDATLKGAKARLKDPDFATGNIFNGLTQGLQGLMGAYTAASGVLAQFGADEKDLQKVQTRLQGSMSLLMGLQQVYNALQAESAFRTQVLDKVSIGLAKAYQKVAASSTLAKLGVAGLVAGLVIGVAAAVAALSKYTKKQKELRKVQSEAASSVSDQVVAYMRLQKQWKEAEGNIKKQNAVLADSKWQKVGADVRNFNDAQRILVDESDKVIEALMAQAEAAALYGIANEKAEQAVKNRLKAEDLRESADRGEVGNLGDWLLGGLAALGTGKSWRESALGYKRGRAAIKENKAEQKETEIKTILDSAANKETKATEGGLIDEEAERLKEAGRKVSDMMKDQARERERLQKDLEFDIRQKRIDVMKDSTAKELAQMSLDHDKEMESLKRQKEDRLKQLQDEQMARQKAGNPNLKDYQTGSNIHQLPKEEAEKYAEQEKLLNEAYQRSTADLLLKYDSLATQRADLERKWEETIGATTDERIKKILEKERNLELAQFDEQAVEQFGTKSQKYKAMKARMDAEVDALVDDMQKKIAAAANEVELAEFLFGDASSYNNLAQAKEAVMAIYQARIKQAQAEEDVVKEQQLQRELAQELLELQKQYSATFALIYADAQKLTTNQLQKAIEATQEAIKEAANSGDIQALTDLYERLREQMNVMGDRERGWGFSGMISGANRLQDADFKRMQAEALSAIDADMFAEEIKRLMEDAINDDEQGWAAINKGAQEVKDTLGGIGEMLQSFGDDTEGWAKALYDVGGFLTGLSSGLDNIETAFSKTASAGDKISVAVSGTVELLSMVGRSVAENRKAQEAWNKTIDESQQKLRMLKLDALDYKQQNIFGVENPYKKAIDGATQYAAAMGELSKMTAKLNEGQVQTGTKKAVDWKNVGKGATTGLTAGAAVGSFFGPIGAAIGAAIGAGVGALAGALATKTVPVFESLRSQYGELFNPDTYELNEKLVADYDKLDEDTKQIVDNWEEIRQKALEAEGQMRQTFSDLAGDIGTQLSDALVEAFRNGDLYSAIDDFHKKMTSTIEDILEQLVFSATFGALFDELEDRMMKSFGVGGDGDIVDDLTWLENEYPRLLGQYEDAMNQVKKSMDKLGYDIWTGEDQRKAQTRSSLGASQDSVDESNARLTTIQGHTFEINENVKKLVAAASTGMSEAILPSFPAMEMPVVVDYTEELLRIREDLGTLAQNDDRFMAALAELQGTADGIRSSSDQVRDNTQGTNDLTGRIRSALDMVVDSGVKMK